MTRLGVRWTARGCVGGIALSLAFLANAAPLAAQDARPDSTRLAGLAGPTSAAATIEEDSKPKDPLVRLPITLFEPWQRWKTKVKESTGLTYGVTYQLAYSNASASIDDGESSSAGGVFSANARWTMWGGDSGNAGTLTLQVENRHVYGDYTSSPQLLAFQTGTMIPTASKFGEASTRILLAHWSQGLFGGRAGFVIGHLAPDDYFSHHQLMHPFMGFMGLGSVFSPSIHLPNPGLGLGVGAWVADEVQVKAAVSDAAGDAYGDEFWDVGDELFDGNMFKTAEVAWIPDSDNTYAKRLALTGWHVNAYEGSTEGYGVALASNWTVGKWVPTLLAGWSNGGGANTLADMTVTAGTGYHLRSKDVLGATISWVDPVGDLRNQYTTEIYLRLYLSDALAITPNLQWVIDPALNTDVGSVTYFQLRSRLAL